MTFHKITKDFCILPGGADINPEIYNAKAHPRTHFYESLRFLDEQHIRNYHTAIKRSQPIIAICRGHQLVAALNGLKLIQHTNHAYGHDVLVKDLETGVFDSSVYTNSIHHQMVWTNNELCSKPNDGSHTDWEVVGYTSKLSTVFHGEIDNEYAHCIIEPEIMVYPEISCITCQFHPEMMDHDDKFQPCLDYLYSLIDTYIKS